MPVEENGAPGTATNNPMGSWQQPWSISDLGDILLDKSLDTMQKNDFVAVTKNDVASLGGNEEEDYDPFAKPAPVVDSTPLPEVESHATIEDLQNIMLETPTSESPFSAQTTTTTKEDTVAAAPVANNDDFHLWDISTPVVEIADVNPPVVTDAVVENVAQVVETITPTTENSGSSLDFDLGDIGVATPTDVVVEDIPPIKETIVEEIAPDVQVAAPTEDSTNSLDFDLDLGSTSTETEVVDEEVVEEVVEETNNSSIDLWSLEDMIHKTTAEPIAEQGIIDTPVAVEEIAPEINQDIVIDTSSLETPVDAVEEVIPVVENNITPEIVQEAETLEVVSPVTIATPITDVASTETTDVWSELDGLQDTMPTETVPQPTNNPEAVALEKVADDITQGIDLDSLMVDSPTSVAAVQVADEATAKQTPTEWLKAIFSWSNGNQKKVLLWLWAFALIGLIYFGYVLMADSSPSVPTPQVTNQVDQDTWDTMDELSGDVVVDEIATWSSDGLSWDIIIDDVATWDITTNSGSINTWSITPVAKTPAEILSSVKDLAGQVRKALIKATIMKNAQMRLSAFGLQKDIETFIQTLENSNDITTVSDSETKVNSLSQRLDTILQKLDGNSQ